MTVMATSDYKNYSVDKVREWVQDALQTEATGEEIADAILGELQYEVEYHMEAMTKASDVLARLKAKREAPNEFWKSLKAKREAPNEFWKSKNVTSATATDWEDFWHSPEKHGAWK